jgi:hypothetical protein
MLRREEAAMRKPLEIHELTAAEAESLDTLYRTTRDVRLRTRAQIVLLAGEQRVWCGYSIRSPVLAVA